MEIVRDESSSYFTSEQRWWIVAVLAELTLLPMAIVVSDHWVLSAAASLVVLAALVLFNPSLGFVKAAALLGILVACIFAFVLQMQVNGPSPRVARLEDKQLALRYRLKALKLENRWLRKDVNELYDWRFRIYRCDPAEPLLCMLSPQPDSEFQEDKPVTTTGYRKASE